VATATSTGTAKTESDLRSAQQPGEPPPPMTVVLAAPPATTTVIAAPAAPRVPKSAGSPCAPKAKSNKPPDKNAPACDKPASPEAQPADATAERDPRKS
jgi:hypothetical protein